MNYEDLSPEEQLHMENQLLRLKLQIETNAKLISTENNLPPEIENAWLTNVYNFEKNFQETSTQTVYDFIGKPVFKKLSELKEDEIENALTELMELMFSKGIAFLFMPRCYKKEVIYQFVTEELFLHEGRFPHMEGEGKWVFHYEDFHPNHKYDLWRHSMDYMELLFDDKEWQDSHLEYSHCSLMRLNSEEILLDDYSTRIIRFKESYPSVLFSNPDVGAIDFDLETGLATVNCEIEMPKENLCFKIFYNYQEEWWIVSGLEISLL